MKFGLWGLLGAGALICAPAGAQAPRSVYLYNAAVGAPGPGINMAKAAPWGNGVARNSRVMDFEGAPVLEVTARNFNEGARFDLNSPLDISPYAETGFIRLRVRFNDAGGGPGGPGGFPGGGFPGGGFPGGGFDGEGGEEGGPRRGRGRRGGFQGGEGGGFQGGDGGGFNNGGGGFGAPDGGGGFIPPGAIWRGNRQMGGALPPLGGAGFPGPGMIEGEGGMPGMPPVAMGQSTPITKLQVTLIREAGATTGRITVDPDKLLNDEDGWHLYVLPLREMRSTPNAAGPVQRIVLTADKEDTFYMAQAALVAESPQIIASIRRSSDPAGTQQAEITVKPGPISLVADVEAGAADPAIEWNFDADNVGNLPPATFGGGPAPAVPGGMEGGMMGGMPPAVAPPGMMNPGVREPIRRPAAPPEVLGGEVAPQVGPRVDARGLTANFTYPNEEQNYRVEVTVRDRSGQKPPVTTSILVKVRG